MAEVMETTQEEITKVMNYLMSLAKPGFRFLFSNKVRVKRKV